MSQRVRLSRSRAAAKPCANSDSARTNLCHAVRSGYPFFEPSTPCKHDADDEQDDDDNDDKDENSDEDSDEQDVE